MTRGLRQPFCGPFFAWADVKNHNANNPEVEQEMECRWIDISLTLSDRLAVWPGDEPFRLKSVVGEEGCMVSSVCMSLHCGTHLDAPLHYLPGGSPVEAAPPEVLLGPAKVVEIRTQRHILPGDLRPVKPSPGDRILIKTGGNATHPSGGFNRDYTAITPEAASSLAKSGVILVGIDAPSIEPWEGDGRVHRILAEAGIWVLEGLELGEAEPGEYLLVCLPLKIEGAEASPARALIGRMADITWP